ncbi:MAG: hypothetical protein FJ387_09625 [Verrucomicrobia bacterium]|nr:hypothetical protein [Verrucomicrobiota bacterium]
MSPDGFVPFLAQARSASGTSPQPVRVDILSGDRSSPPFEPVQVGRMSPHDPPDPKPTAHESHPAEPKITLERDADRVTHIVIACGCGKVIRLECVY